MLHPLLVFETEWLDWDRSKLRMHHITGSAISIFSLAIHIHLCAIIVKLENIAGDKTEPYNAIYLDTIHTGQ
jgi:hypothetical protein